MMTEPPQPTLDELTTPYWEGVAEGELRIQRCRDCGNVWLPPRSECPNCWGDSWEREAASGRGTLISWIVYHRAYHPYFEDRLPYNVAVVELEEGARLISNMVDDPSELEIDAPVELVFEDEGGRVLPRFRLAGDPAPA